MYEGNCTIDDEELSELEQQIIAYIQQLSERQIIIIIEMLEGMTNYNQRPEKTV